MRSRVWADLLVDPASDVLSIGFYVCRWLSVFFITTPALDQRPLVGRAPPHPRGAGHGAAGGGASDGPPGAVSRRPPDAVPLEPPGRVRARALAGDVDGRQGGLPVAVLRVRADGGGPGRVRPVRVAVPPHVAGSGPRPDRRAGAPPPPERAGRAVHRLFRAGHHRLCVRLDRVAGPQLVQHHVRRLRLRRDVRLGHRRHHTVGGSPVAARPVAQVGRRRPGAAPRSGQAAVRVLDVLGLHLGVAVPAHLVRQHP